MERTCTVLTNDKRPLVRASSRWDDNIKTNFQEIGDEVYGGFLSQKWDTRMR